MEAGERIDGWVVDQRLGAGGMGSVYRCRNAATDRLLAAVKVLEAPLRSSEEAQARFAREAHILARLDHPGIVRVRNVRIDADPPYLEMEFIEGESLEEQIRRGPTPYVDAVAMLRQIADAVRYLHAAGVRHRDLKPANLIVDSSGRVRLVDFGLATETDLARITAEGLNFGTVSYAPPEWIDPGRLDPVQWDLYALGVLFHELLTGKMAFPMSGEGPVRKQLLQVMMVKQNAPPLDPGPEFPEEVRAMIRELTAFDPAARPQSAEEVVARLEGLPGIPSEAKTVPLVPERREEPRRGPWALAIPAAALGGVLGAVALAYALWPSPPPPPPPPPAPLPEPVAGVPPPPSRAVEVAIEGARDLPVRVRAGGVEVEAAEGRARLDGVPLDAAEVVWVAGAGCEGCPGEGCPAWCGTGTLAVPPGDAPASLTAVIHPGTGSVTVVLPMLADEIDGGPFRKKKPIWHVVGRLDGRSGALPNHWSIRWDEVLAGEHEIVAQIGGCPEAARGCWPDGNCPAHCASVVREVVVPWSGGAVTEKIRMPPPP